MTVHSFKCTHSSRLYVGYLIFTCLPDIMPHSPELTTFILCQMMYERTVCGFMTMSRSVPSATLLWAVRKHIHISFIKFSYLIHTMLSFALKLSIKEDNGEIPLSFPLGQTRAPSIGKKQIHWLLTRLRQKLKRYPKWTSSNHLLTLKWFYTFRNVCLLLNSKQDILKHVVNHAAATDFHFRNKKINYRSRWLLVSNILQYNFL